MVGPDTIYGGGRRISAYTCTNDFNDAIEGVVAVRIVEEVGVDVCLEFLFVGVEEGIVWGTGCCRRSGGWVIA